MKGFFILAATLCSTFLMGKNSAEIFSKDRMVHFYDEFLHEEKEALVRSGQSDRAFPLPINRLAPPANPPAPPFKNGLLPVVLVNNSTLPDSAVYILVTGKSISGSNPQVWGQVNTDPGSNFGVVSLINVADGQNSTTYSYPLSSLPRGSTGRIIYLPQTISGLIWFSMSTPLNMPVTGNSIVQPIFTNPQDVNYATNFDIFEFTYLLSGSPQVNVDATAVSFFSIPLYGYLAGATSSASNTGLHHPRSYIMNYASSLFNGSVENSQWNNLLLSQNGNILRCLSTGKAIGASLFDANYLDNAASYGYSYISQLWNSVINLQVTTTSPAGTFNYTSAAVAAGNPKVFTSNNGGPDVTFLASTTSGAPTGTTTYNIFSALNLTSPTSPPTAGTAADAVSKLVEESVIAGLLPTTNTLSLSYLSANQSNFYTTNPNLNTGNTGPWYDLYSKALHSLGSIYTYGFDEPLWPQVLLTSPFTNNQTYVGITIGPID